MGHFLLLRSPLLLLLMAAVATGQERATNVRYLSLSGGPEQEVPSVNVASQVATVLRFEQPLHPDKTRMLGWEGRFEPPLACGPFALLMPLKEVTAEERFLLLVTLQDGTEVPFTVKGHDTRVDQQVNVFVSPDSPDALRARHEHALRRMRKYEEENERLRKEQNSVDHAFASLLAINGSAKDTPFRRRVKWRVDSGGAVVDIFIYSAKKLGKAAVLFHVTNSGLEVPWSLKEVQLSAMLGRQSPTEPVRTGERKAFASRTDRNEIPPGESGFVAVVADQSAFASKEGPAHLVLELFRHDGLQQAVVLLDHRILTE